MWVRREFIKLKLCLRRRDVRAAGVDAIFHSSNYDEIAVFVLRFSTPLKSAENKFLALNFKFLNFLKTTSHGSFFCFGCFVLQLRVSFRHENLKLSRYFVLLLLNLRGCWRLRVKMLSKFRFMIWSSRNGRKFYSIYSY